ncbi:ACT domain-containing protein [Streptomonospora wellingtoniae]|uniref:ACT domain-containing protein n=1 Tax=Streptomonospora wellingtoniae TaxID=3075544 RepID=A0ABU2KWY0_9ACTN|nr:hypothetical protein [Streptomonospora sp. DSM 45055]MDT0303815.1 hypothetical protein [Streptomonospora sp. DSM 45055]
MSDDVRTDVNVRGERRSARREPVPRGFLGQELVDVGGLLLAAGAAHLLVLSLGHSDYGGRMLAAAGAALLAVSTLHRWRRHRAGGRAPGGRPAAPQGGAAGHGGAALPEAARAERERLWRVRVAVDDVPGGLAALTAQMARHGVDIRLLQVHPAAGEAVDDLYVTAPAGAGAEVLREAAVRAGGRRPVVEPADVRDLADTAARALSLLAGLVGGQASLPEVLASVSGARDVARRPAPPPGLEAEDLRRTEMTLPDPEGGVLLLRREIPFTPVEFARCRALVRAAACLHERLRAHGAPEL